MRCMSRLALALALLATAYGSSLIVDAVDWLPGDAFVAITGGFNVIAPDGSLKETVDIAARVQAFNPGLTDRCRGSDVRAIALNPNMLIGGTPTPTLWVACEGGTNPRLVIFNAAPTGAHPVLEVWTAFGRPWLDVAIQGSITYALFTASDGNGVIGQFANPFSRTETFLPTSQGRLAVAPDGTSFTTPASPLSTAGQLITKWVVPSSLQSTPVHGLASAAEGAGPLDDSMAETLLLAGPGTNRTAAQGVRVMQTLVGTAFGASFPVGAFARHLETSSDGQFLLLTGDGLNDGEEQCAFAQPLDGSDQTALSCALGSVLWSVADGLPGQQTFFANTPDGSLFRFASAGGTAQELWTTNDAATTQTGLEVSGVAGNPSPEPVCSESNFIGPSTSGDAAWWGPYRPGAGGGVDPALSPASWIDRCAQEVELCQAQQQTSDPADACVCQAWSCLNPPAGGASPTAPECKSALPALRRFYCGLAKTADCSAFDDLPPLPDSCDTLPAAAHAARRKPSRRALHAAA